MSTNETEAVRMERKPDSVRVAITLTSGTVWFTEYVYQTYNPDGSLRERFPVPSRENVSAELAKLPLPEGEAIERWRFIEVSEIPNEAPQLRAAVRDDGTRLHYDLEVARELQRQRAQARRGKLSKQDDERLTAARSVAELLAIEP